MSAINSFPIHEVDYSPKQQGVKSSYRYTKIVQQTGGTTTTITKNPVETIFELPPRVMNFSESYLNATLTVPALGAGRYAWMFVDKPPIRSIDLYTRGGMHLCEVNNVQEYLKIRLKEAQRDSIDYFSTNSLSFGQKNINATTANLRHDGSNPELVCDPQYFAISGAAAALTLYLSIPLSHIKDTILSCNKNFYFNEVVLLKITWAQKSEWGVSNDSAADPTSDPTTWPADTQDLAISNMYLYLALENDPILSSQLIQQVSNGSMSVIIPWVHSFWNHPGSGGAAGAIQTVSVRLNSTMGNHLKKVYHAFYPATRTAFFQFNLSNLAKTQIVYYHTKLDNMRRTDFNITTADNDDFNLRKNKLKGTFNEVIDTFRYNWYVVDDYDMNGDVPDKMCVASGLPLGVEHQWNIEASCADEAFNHYTFATVSRILTISNQGIIVQ